MSGELEMVIRRVSMCGEGCGCGSGGSGGVMGSRR